MYRKEWTEVARLFAATAFEMLRERNECGRIADEPVLQDMWREFRATIVYVKQGSKVSINRFTPLVTTGQFETGVWAMKTVVYEYVCVDLDLLGSKQAGGVILQRQQQHGSQENLDGGGRCEHDAQTAPELVETALRRSIANAMPWSVVSRHCPRR